MWADDMYSRMVKCKQSRFWTENVITEGIRNWIEKKYDYQCQVILFDFNNIVVEFKGHDKNPDEEKIINDVANTYNLELINMRKGCVLDIKTNESSKFHSYELKKRWKNEEIILEDDDEQTSNP